MKMFFIPDQFTYNGSQLRPLFAYENYNILGPSIVSWIGPCNISLDHMIDLEDKIVHAEIRGDVMLHFIIEIFDASLLAAVGLQRLFAAMVKDQIETRIKESALLKLVRGGDDIYLLRGQEKFKLSISIASKSNVSVMIHFAINIVNDGTPVPTACLEQFGIDPRAFAVAIMESFGAEFRDIGAATMKVRPL